MIFEQLTRSTDKGLSRARPSFTKWLLVPSTAQKCELIAGAPRPVGRWTGESRRQSWWCHSHSVLDSHQLWKLHLVSIRVMTIHDVLDPRLAAWYDGESFARARLFRDMIALPDLVQQLLKDPVLCPEKKDGFWPGIRLTFGRMPPG
jgi:hypothetical protein